MQGEEGPEESHVEVMAKSQPYIIRQSQRSERVGDFNTTVHGCRSAWLAQQASQPSVPHARRGHTASATASSRPRVSQPWRRRSIPSCQPGDPPKCRLHPPRCRLDTVSTFERSASPCHVRAASGAGAGWVHGGRGGRRAAERTGGLRRGRGGKGLGAERSSEALRSGSALPAQGKRGRRSRTGAPASAVGAS